MPYVDDTSRSWIDEGRPARTPGELNYQLTRLVIAYLRGQRSYALMNEVVGVLEQVKDEFQRRVVHPYEDKKCAENGDVYPKGY